MNNTQSASYKAGETKAQAEVIILQLNAAFSPP